MGIWTLDDSRVVRCATCRIVVTIPLCNKNVNRYQSPSIMNRDSVNLIASLMNNGNITNILKAAVELVSRL